MGPKHHLVHFKSLLGCLLIKSWSSFQHMYAGKNMKGNPIFTFPPCFPFHIGEVIQIWLARLMGSLGNISLTRIKVFAPREECSSHIIILSCFHLKLNESQNQYLTRVFIGKLDGVGLVDNRSSTDNLTCDTWHVKRDTWHVWGWTFSQIFSSLALNVCDLWYYEDLEEKAHSINHSCLRH